MFDPNPFIAARDANRHEILLALDALLGDLRDAGLPTTHIDALKQDWLTQYQTRQAALTAYKRPDTDLP